MHTCPQPLLGSMQQALTPAAAGPVLHHTRTQQLSILEALSDDLQNARKLQKWSTGRAQHWSDTLDMHAYASRSYTSS